MSGDLPDKSSCNKPQPVSDTVIWRAANQMLQRYKDIAWLEASQRADAALELGDTFNFELWQRVAKAVLELERTKPGEGESIN